MLRLLSAKIKVYWANCDLMESRIQFIISTEEERLLSKSIWIGFMLRIDVSFNFNETFLARALKTFWVAT